MPARLVSSTSAVSISVPASSSSSSSSPMLSSPPGCGFCKRNREAHEVYMSHELKDTSGRVTCPQLRKYRCPGCGSTGDEAHTRSYCPQLTGVRQQQQQRQARVGQQTSGAGFHSFMPTTSTTFLGNHHQAPPLATRPIYNNQQRPVAATSAHNPGGFTYYDQNNYNQTKYLHQQQQHYQQQQPRHQLFVNKSGAGGALLRNEVSPPRVGGGGGCSSSDSDDIHLGRSQALNNMSKVTNSRYNSAGRLRHRSSRKHNNQAGQFNFNLSQ